MYMFNWSGQFAVHECKLNDSKAHTIENGELSKGKLLYLAPTILLDHIDDEMIESWMEYKQSIGDWMTKFRLASN